MSSQLLRPRFESPQETIRLLQRELAETNREVMALTVELEKRVEERTADLRAAQSELEWKNARLEAANKELEAFSYSVSHDLRAPLRHLHGYAHALAEDFQATLGPGGLEYLKNITKSVEQMSTLIDDLLSFARAGQQPLEKTEINFQELVHKIITEVQPEQGKRQIDWVVGPLPSGYGDPAMLRQVWVNLISNAVKYTRQRETARIEIGSSDSSDQEMVFFVRDNGAGFDMAHAARLFGLFQRLHNRSDFEGTGLGLANVRRIINRHAGRTWAEGEVGKGATFYFSLPRKSE
jgi:light-regulated signal transduction histidine kinase (bacteriophytochrome)